MPSSELISQNQLDSLDDTDCYASIWEQILSEERDSQSNTKANLWGGRGRGGRGLARRTIQPRDIVVEDVRLQYLGRSDAFLDGATIKLLHNHVYALIGRNGCGKSTLMKRMCSQKIPGWSTQWSSLYIPPDLPSELMPLSPLQVIQKYLVTCKQNSQTAAESRISDLEDQIEKLNVDEDQEEMERLCEEMSRLEESRDSEHNYLESKNVYGLLQDLQINPDVPCEKLSTTQQKEVLLLVASVFAPLANLLLLDEPARNLDVQGLLRLRRQIEGFPATVVMVSHDVDLINDVATDIIDMHACNLYYYPGNYDSYRLMKEQRVTHILHKSLAMEKKYDKLKSTLQQLKEHPTPKRKGGAKKKAKAITCQRKKMEWHKESMGKLDASSEILPERKGLTAAQRLKLAETLKATPDKAVQFALPPTSSQWGEALIVAHDVGYGTDKEATASRQNVYPDCLATTDSDGNIRILKRDVFLFDCVDICIEEGSINCLLGSNCSSFLLKILAKRLAPVEGTVYHAAGVRVGFCNSQTISELVSSADSATTVLQFLSQHYPQKSENELRGHLTLFGLSPTSQRKTPICYLSGGETFRFVLAKVMLDDPPVLCIENPTASLDVESVQALAHGLKHWNGTVVMRSVDAFFLRLLGEVNCFVIVPEEGKLRRIPPGMHGIDGYLKTVKLF